jgi:ABC-2 type transport system permease protein
MTDISHGATRKMTLGHRDGRMWSRVMALVLRHLYLLRGSWPRFIELVYWPMIQLTIWGFINSFMAENSNWVAQAAGVLVGAVLLWEVVLRGQLGITLSFMEEMWSRNLGHLFVSPLHPLEWTVSLVLMSMVRSAIGLFPAFLLAALLQQFNLFDLGLPLLAFFANLMMMGWWLGIIIMAVILRHGLGAESFAWMALFVLAPFSCVYYPLEALPVWLQYFAVMLPATHVFEGMRSVLFGEGVNLLQLACAFGLNIVYLIISSALLLAAFRHARIHGKLLQMGE